LGGRGRRRLGGLRQTRCTAQLLVVDAPLPFVSQDLQRLASKQSLRWLDRLMWIFGIRWVLQLLVVGALLLRIGPHLSAWRMKKAS